MLDVIILKLTTTAFFMRTPVAITANMIYRNNQIGPREVHVPMEKT